MTVGSYGIIRRMNQLKDICRMIKVIEERTEQLEKVKLDPKIKNVDKIFETLWPRITDVQENFKKKHNCSKSRAVNAYNDAIKGDYIKPIKNFKKANEKYAFDRYVTVNTSGRKLNSTVGKIPTGRYNKWLEDNSSFMNFLFGSAVTAIVTIVGLVLNAIYG
jgi:hypothetical protein